MDQTNRDEGCYPLCILDIALLARGRVDRKIKDDTNPTDKMPLIRITRQENYSQPEKATQLTIKVYKSI